MPGALFLAWLGAPASAHADPPKAPSSEQAERLFKEGREALSRGEYDIACSLLKKSVGLDPARGATLNLALCEEARGRTATALARFRQVEELFEPSDPRKALARSHIAVLATRVPHLIVRRGLGGTAELQVFVDDQLLPPSEMGVPLEVDPGAHRVTVVDAGRSSSGVVRLGDGQTGEYVATVPLAAGPALEVTAESAPRDGRLFRVGVALSILGGTGIATSGAFGIAALERNGDRTRFCNEQKECQPPGLAAVQDQRRFTQVATTAFVSGAVVLGVGTVMLLLSRGQDGTSR